MPHFVSLQKAWLMLANLCGEIKRAIAEEAKADYLNNTAAGTEAPKALSFCPVSILNGLV